MLSIVSYEPVYTFIRCNCNTITGFISITSQFTRQLKSWLFCLDCDAMRLVQHGGTTCYFLRARPNYLRCIAYCVFEELQCTQRRCRLVPVCLHPLITARRKWCWLFVTCVTDVRSSGVTKAQRQLCATFDDPGLICCRVALYRSSESVKVMVIIQ